MENIINKEHTLYNEIQMDLIKFVKDYGKIILIAIIGIVNAALLYSPLASLITNIINISLLTFILANFLHRIRSFRKD